MSRQLAVHSASGSRVWSVRDLDEVADRGRVPVAEVLPDGTAETHATVESRDGSYRASIPLDVLRRGGVLLVDGRKARLEVEDGATLCWNVKDVGTIRLTAGKEPDSVPENPSH